MGKALGFRVAILDHAAGMHVDGGRGVDEVEIGIAEALLPEHHADLVPGGAEAGPDALALDQGGGLFPEEDFAEIGEADAVCHHAMGAGLRAGAEAGLGGAGDGGKEGLGRAKAGAVFDEVPAEGCDLDDEEFGGHDQLA